MRLKREFYVRDTRLLAKDLLGKILVFRDEENLYRARIVETEAYAGQDDDGAHFHKGLTHRTRIIDEEGGHIYIYTIYGMYLLFNIVGEREGVHGAALVRALEPIEGIEEMYRNRYKKEYKDWTRREIINLTNGPGKLVMALNMGKEVYGKDLVTDPNIWIEDAPGLGSEDIVVTTRINIDYAEQAKDYLYRYYIRDNPFVSKK